MMIFIGTQFCNLHRDANGLHLRQTSVHLYRAFQKKLKRANEIFWGGSLIYYRVLGLAPAARPRREHSVLAGCTAGKRASNAVAALKIGLHAT